jgi:hypothetical protein
MIKGQMPLGMSNRFSMNGTKGVEIYAHSRYVTITGEIWSETATPLRKFENDKWLTILPILGHSGNKTAQGCSPTTSILTKKDERNIERLERDEKHGAEFRALFLYGDLGRYGGDQSKADLRLTTLVANVVGFDEAAIDRIIRASKLFRKKWDTGHRHDGATYGQMTIEKVLLTRFVRHKGETEGFLQFHYGFRYNEVRGMVEWRKRGVSDWQLLDDRGFATILRHLRNQRGTLGEGALHSLITSDFCPSFDPFVHFFESLPKEDGTSEIDKLIATVTSDDPDYFRFTFMK